MSATITAAVQRNFPRFCCLGTGGRRTDRQVQLQQHSGEGEVQRHDGVGRPLQARGSFPLFLVVVALGVGVLVVGGGVGVFCGWQRSCPSAECGESMLLQFLKRRSFSHKSVVFALPPSLLKLRTLHHPFPPHAQGSLLAQAYLRGARRDQSLVPEARDHRVVSLPVVAPASLLFERWVRGLFFLVVDGASKPSKSQWRLLFCLVPLHAAQGTP